jgi:6-phosphogluconolactonase
MPDRKVYETVDELITATATRFIEVANEAIRLRGVFNVVLSGGNSPRKLYELLADKYNTSLDWQKVKIFFADERYVPADHPDNNGGMIKNILIPKLNIPDCNIFLINTALPVEQAAADYEFRINHAFDSEQVYFDLVLLGMGDDGHTASLFPGTKVLQEKAAGIRPVFLASKNSYRITMTAKLLNQGDNIVFLVYGESKAQAVYDVLLGSTDPNEIPALLIHSERGTTEWFLDNKAAGK